jgi:hypothetical protein
MNLAYSDKQAIAPLWGRIIAGCETFACEFSKLAAGGALLLVAEGQPLPDFFDLEVGQSLKRARLVWREGASVAAEFLAEDESEFAASRALRLSVENKLLRTQAAILSDRLETLGHSGSPLRFVRLKRKIALVFCLSIYAGPGR